MDNKLYTTPEASQLTGIKESTIRSWLTRYPQVFQIDTHVVVDENGRKLWTDAGIELLRSRASKPATDNDATNDATSLLEAILDRDSEALAEEYWRQLPGRVLRRIKLMHDNPTPKQRELVQTSVRAALNAGTSHLLLPVYQPMLLGSGDEQTAAD
jgi:DNA-binding transcriptional MerR regulator